MSFFDLLKTFVPLVLVLGLLYGVLILVRKYSISFKPGSSGPVSVKVLSSQMIMPKRYVSIVKVKDKLLVLGVSEHSINLLKEFDYIPEEFENIANEGVKPSFLDMLRKNLPSR